MVNSDAFISCDFSLCVRGSCSRSRIRSQPSGTRMVNMNRGMSRRSSEVRTKHALAGMKGHSHLVIWVNYKCCRPQGGKMSWTAVSADTHTHTHTRCGSPPVSTVRTLHCIQVDMVKKKKSLFSFKPSMQKHKIECDHRAHQQISEMQENKQILENETLKEQH